MTFSALRTRLVSHIHHCPKLFSSASSIFTRSFSSHSDLHSSNNNGNVDGAGELLCLQEVEKILKDVTADDVKVIPVPKHCEFADYMVIATGRSEMHVRNIARAIMYKAKQKQKGAGRMLLPSVVGQEGGKWIVIDSGKLIIHALDEDARAYYNLESRWTSDSLYAQTQDLDKASLDKAFVKIRPKNNSKKRPKAEDGKKH